METQKKVNIDRNTGFLHVAENKSNDKSPDYFGTIDIDGILYRMAGWKKAAEGEDMKNFISVNLDIESWSEDMSKKIHEDALERFKEDRKKKENIGQFLLIDWTGTIHKTSDDKIEDFFGSFKIGEKEDSIIKYVKGFASKTKKGKPVIRLEVSDGSRSKEERAEIANDIL